MCKKLNFLQTCSRSGKKKTVQIGQFNVIKMLEVLIPPYQSLKKKNLEHMRWILSFNQTK